MRVRFCALLFFVAGCGSSNTLTPTPGAGDGGACPGYGATASCVPCMQSACLSQSNAALGPRWASNDFSGGACADLIACECNCGTDGTCIHNCESSRMTCACRDAITQLDACATTQCPTGQCAKAQPPAKDCGV